MHEHTRTHEFTEREVHVCFALTDREYAYNIANQIHCGAGLAMITA